MTPVEMWRQYCAYSGTDPETRHDIWAFCGGGPAGDELARLVLEGKKTGTASWHDAYLAENEPLPGADQYSVIHFDNGEAACVIRNYEVCVLPFDRVTPWHAWLEGEFHRTLAEWRQAHRELFTQECPEYGLTFSEQGRVVMERFHAVWPPEAVCPEELFFTEPSEAYADEIAAFRQEFIDDGSSMDGTGALRRLADPHEWIRASLNYAVPDLPVANPKWVHCTQLMAVRRSDGRVVGMLQLRHELNDFLRDVAGHIGYAVRPSERRRGYARWMLNASLPYARAMGISGVLVSCLDGNTASRKTILSAGGRYLSTVPDGDAMVERYIIEE